MKLPSSLRSRIFLTSALLAVLSVGAAVYLVSATVVREAERGLQREITAAGAIFNELSATRAQTFTNMARLIADAPTLKAAVDTDDPPTVQDVASDYQQQLGSNILVVTNRSARVLATVGLPPGTAALIAGQQAVKEAATGEERFSLIRQPDGILQLVVVPILIGRESPQILGTLSVGYRFDQALAAQLKEITGSDVAFGMDGQILAATLAPEDRPALTELLRRGEDPRNVTLGTGEYVALPMPIAAQSAGADRTAGPVALILRSRTEQLRVLRAIRAELAVTALVAAGLAMLLSFAVARTITRPLAAITDVMREVAATGDLTRKIVLRGTRDDEDARLLASTFNTLTDSIARVQREMSQRERLSSLGRLSTVIAHEVRNPLMIIKAALHTLRQRGLSEESVREAAADIDGEVARLNRMVNEVLDFARPIQFELAPTDINLLCRESAAAAAAAPGAGVQLDLAASLPLIAIDAERLRVALVNLLVNARQAVEAGAGGEARAVFLSTRHGGDHISILVADMGSGIAGADLPRVFDPFFTTKRGGTGLGLPIAKNIVEGLGGTIAVASAPGRGTEIRIDFPLGSTPTGHSPHAGPVADTDGSRMAPEAQPARTTP